MADSREYENRECHKCCSGSLYSFEGIYENLANKICEYP